ncbi:hypothetical protein M8J76_008338 [Diaphorina citri]|nr:hypothetical protein M8J76_008338 [Diaphorina citri]
MILQLQLLNCNCNLQAHHLPRRMSTSTLHCGPNILESYMSDEDMIMGKEENIECEIIMVHCRLCTAITHKQEGFNIFESDKNIADKIARCLPILIIPQDKFSKYICETCSDQLELCNDLTIKSVEAEKLFKKQLEEEELAKQMSTKKEKIINMNQETKKTLNPNGPVICDLCGHKKFSNMETFDAHMVSVHNAPQLGNPELVFTEDGIAVFECRACQKQFESESDLRTHESTHIELTCKSCFEFHSTAQALQRHTCPNPTLVEPLLPSPCTEVHVQLDLEDYSEEVVDSDMPSVHNENYITPPDPLKVKKFECKKCFRSFTNAGNLARHEVTHLQQIACDVCEKKFTTYSFMLKHRREHGGNLSFDNCHICKETFYKHSELVRHLEREHNIPRSESSPWCCRFCNKRMMTKLSLGIHERIHTGQRPYICDWCGVGFRSKANLLQHQPVHTGQRKYNCTVCGKAFSRKSFVTTHMRVHTGDRPYDCDVCGAKFTQVGDMRRHRKKHDENGGSAKDKPGAYTKTQVRHISLSKIEEEIYAAGDSNEDPVGVSIIEIHVPGENPETEFRILTSEDENLTIT